MKVFFLYLGVVFFLTMCSCAGNTDAKLTKSYNKEDVVDTGTILEWNEFGRFCGNLDIPNSQETKKELTALKEEYRKRFGQDVEIYVRSSYTGQKFLIDDIDVIVLLRRALKNGEPFPKREYSISFSDIRHAQYESCFDRKVPICQLMDDACNDLPCMLYGYSKIDTANCYCSRYLMHDLIVDALRTNKPLPEKITFNKLGLFTAAYKKSTGKESFPAWFVELSYEDKLAYLMNSIKTDGSNSYSFRAFLSKEEEDSIKNKLEIVVAEYKDKNGIEMTELEKTKAEYEIQFGRKVPVHQCSEDGLIEMLKHTIKYNVHIHHVRLEGLVFLTDYEDIIIDEQMMQNINERLLNRDAYDTDFIDWPGNDSRTPLDCTFDFSR